MVECKEHWIKNHEIITLLASGQPGKNFLTFFCISGASCVKWHFRVLWLEATETCFNLGKENLLEWYREYIELMGARKPGLEMEK